MDDMPRPEVVIPTAFGCFFAFSIFMCLCCGYLQKRQREKQVLQMNRTCNQHAQYMSCTNAYPYGQPPVMVNSTLSQLHLPPQVIPGRVINSYNHQVPPHSGPMMDPGCNNLQELPNTPPPKYEDLPPELGFRLPAQQQPPYPVATATAQQQPPYPVATATAQQQPPYPVATAPAQQQPPYPVTNKY